jgi:hypothetical protein
MAGISKDNRFIVLMMAAGCVVGGTLVAILFVIWMDAHPGPGVDPATRVSPLLLIGAITVFGGGALTQIWAMLKNDQDRHLAAHDRELAKTAVQVAQDTQVAAAESRVALHAKVDAVQQTATVVARQTNGEMDEKIRTSVAKAIGPLVEKVASIDARVADIDKEAHKIKHDVNGLLQAKLFAGELATLEKTASPPHP